MPRPPVSPLGDRELEKIRSSLQQLEEGEKQIELAKRAGFDVTSEEERFGQLRKRLTKIKQTYFPDE